MGGGGGPSAGEQLIIDITKRIGSGDPRLKDFLLKRRTLAESYLAHVKPIEEWDRELTEVLIADIDLALQTCRARSGDPD